MRKTALELKYWYRRNFGRKSKWLSLLLLVIFVLLLSKAIRTPLDYNNFPVALNDDSQKQFPPPDIKRIFHPRARDFPSSGRLQRFLSDRVHKPQFYDENKVQLVKKLKTLYNNELESFYFLLGRRFSQPDYNPTNSKQKLDQKPLSDILDLHLFQLNSIEEVKVSLLDPNHHEELAKYVQAVIRFNQNPANCTGRAMVCDPSKSCGFGCQMHHLIYCLGVALVKGRPLVLSRNSWHQFSSFEHVFLPLSTTCTHDDLKEAEQIRIIDILDPKPYFPPAVPTQILKLLMMFNTNPFIWWAGQIASYIFRFKPKTLNRISMERELPHPIVGIHVRRSDKIGSEANEYNLQEYMFWAELFFKKLELKQKLEKRFIFLATDHVGLIDEARERFPEYEFLSMKDHTQSAQNSRFSKNGTYGIISDVHHLSLTDYLVCTFSSQVCRLALELMNSRGPDMSVNAKSLDEVYYFGGQIQRSYNLNMPHYSKTHEDADDIHTENTNFNLKHNDWNGYSHILFFDHKKRSGHVASFKIDENYLSYPFSSFENYDHSEV